MAILFQIVKEAETNNVFPQVPEYLQVIEQLVSSGHSTHISHVGVLTLFFKSYPPQSAFHVQ